MAWLVIQDVKPWDGRYELDTSRDFTTSEWGWIKRLTGWMPLTAEEGLDGGDPELWTAYVVIAMRRAGKIEDGQVRDVYKRLADRPFGTTIRLEVDERDEDDEGDARPPTRSSDANGSSSGDASLRSSDPSSSLPSPFGAPASATSASHPPWSES